VRFVSLILIALTAFGCATSEDVSQARQDVTTVYGEQSTYREKTDARLSRVEKEMKDLQRNLGSQNAGLRKQVLDLSLSAKSTDDKIRGIYGRLDEIESQFRSHWEEMRDELKDLRRKK
jgi:hypothetical protein